MQIAGLLRLFIVSGVAVLLVAFSPATSEPTQLQLPDRTTETFRLSLPTKNDALYHNKGKQFYQYVDRYFGGDVSHPWQAGTYGFVRNPRRVDDKIIYTRMHEGLDIKPIYRDEHNEPLDTVRTISGGRAVYVNDVAGQSSYGKYVVVEHQWNNSLFYSLYAHLSEVFVTEGEDLTVGAHLGRMGYTGRGINRRRAHLHLEVAMLLNEQFQDWYDTYFSSEPNYHQTFSGLNLKGLDVEALLLARQKNPNLSIQTFVLRQPVAYRVTIPNKGQLDLLKRYPWLFQTDKQIAPAQASSLTISFTQTGLPVAVRPSAAKVSEPVVSGVESDRVTRRCITNGVLRRSREGCYVSRTGRRYLKLLTLQTHDASDAKHVKKVQTLQR